VPLDECQLQREIKQGLLTIANIPDENIGKVRLQNRTKALRIFDFLVYLTIASVVVGHYRCKKTSNLLE
jgi:hypothetical protein